MHGSVLQLLKDWSRRLLGPCAASSTDRYSSRQVSGGHPSCGSWLPATGPAVLDHVSRCLAGHFDIEHSTFQVELPEHRSHEGATHQ
jgi:hypothetical protein